MPSTPSAPVIHVIDDEAAFRRSLVFLLESAGWTAMEHDSAEAFLAALPTLQPGGCLVLDVRMPGISGLELQQRLIAERRPWPVVFMTGHGDDELAARAIADGAVAFLRKPCSDQLFLDTIARAVALAADNRYRLSQWQKAGISTSPHAT